MGISNISAPNPEPGALGFLSGLLGGIHGANVQREQSTEQKAEDLQKQQLFNQQSQLNTQTMASNALTLQQTQGTIDQGKKTQAATDLKALTQQMITDPSRAKDPAFVARYNALSKDSGQLPELTKDGKAVDIDRLKTPFSTLDPKQTIAIMQLAPGPRKSILDQYSGVDKSLYHNAAVVTAKDQAALDRVNELHLDHTQRNAIASRIADARIKYFDAETGELIPAKAAEYYARAGLDASRGQAVVTTANATMARAQAYTESVNNLQARFNSQPNGSMGAVRSLLSTSTSQLRGLQTGLNDAQKSLSTDYANVTDPDQLIAAQKAVTDATEALRVATVADQALRASVASNPQVASFLSAGSGKPAENIQPKSVGSAPAGAPDGYYPNAKGGAVTIRGGQLYKGKI